MPVPFIMPKFDMDQEKATIITWEKQEGDAVQLDETVLTVETEKVAIEVPSPAKGILVNILFQPGEVVPVTEVIAYILQEGETRDDLPVIEARNSAPKTPEAAAVRNDKPAEPLLGKPTTAAQTVVKATPLADRIARIEGVDLRQVSPTGMRITGQDVKRYLGNQQHTLPEIGVSNRAGDSLTALDTRSAGSLSAKVAATPAARRLARERGIPLEAISGSGPRGRIQAVDIAAIVQDAPRPFQKNDSVDRQAEIIPLSGIRQTIAERMQASFQEAPHIALTVDVDVTHLEEVRQRLNQMSAREQAAKISITALLVRIAAWALDRNPYLNASLNGGQIYLWKDINIGVATAIDDGLVVPVIHQANTMSVSQIAGEIVDLSSRARQGRLTLSDVQRGTFTISNLGMFGIPKFRAVINPPECAILAVGSVVRKPVVIDEQDTLVVRPMMSITLSADHRIVDGVSAAKFLNDLVEVIEHPDLLLF